MQPHATRCMHHGNPKGWEGYRLVCGTTRAPESVYLWGSRTRSGMPARRTQRRTSTSVGHFTTRTRASGATIYRFDSDLLQKSNALRIASDDSVPQAKLRNALSKPSCSLADQANSRSSSLSPPLRACPPAPLHCTAVPTKRPRLQEPTPLPTPQLHHPHHLQK